MYHSSNICEANRPANAFAALADRVTCVTMDLRAPVLSSVSSTDAD
jgi:hypothetical protein